MNRRNFILSALAGAAVVQGSHVARAREADELAGLSPDDVFARVVERARALSGDSYDDRRMTFNGPFQNLNIRDYQAIRYKPDARVWLNDHLPFQMDLRAPGMVYDRPVTINIVSPEGATPLPFTPDLLEFDPAVFDGANRGRPDANGSSGLSWTGLRLYAPLNRPDGFDDFAIFQGASYFRAIARDTRYGLSARGLAIGTGDQKGEEFPWFSTFWVHRPQPGAQDLRIHALLESASLTGAYDFIIRPGGETTMDIHSVLFPRNEIAQVGVAPLTSMYLFGTDRRSRIDDFRNAVHDSSGLQMVTGHERRLWRPLTNPTTLQTSAFQDLNPTGFGLTQRQRSFDDYQDVKGHYERRPSAWVEPLGDWGEGAVVLVEIPLQNEFNDNIVAFWRPKDPLHAGERYDYSYRLFWSGATRDEMALARVMATRSGSAGSDGNRLYVIDFRGSPAAARDVTPKLEISAGEARNVVVQQLPRDGDVRVAFEYVPGDATSSEFSLFLETPDGPASETWMYRWTT
ncbi:glucan biosynthesis protein [Paroceanicella profunda]|nr:glucan biosynthesis protein G [Paroceanicella profunda]